MYNNFNNLNDMMNYFNDRRGRTDSDELRAARARQMREARERLTEEFVELLRIDPDDGMRWRGSVADLMEAAHIAYTQGTICDSNGQTCTFCAIVKRVCSSLHVKAPVNPRGSAYQAGRRKGVRQEAFIDRYVRKIFLSDVSCPLTQEIERDIIN